MKEIKDQKLVQKYIEENQIRDYFDCQDLRFRLFAYEKDEMLASPYKYLTHLLFIVKGTVKVYGVKENGGYTPVDYMQQGGMIGDLEFTHQSTSMFFAQAVTPVLCIGVHLETYRQILDHDVRFLHVLLQSYAKKISSNARSDVSARTIEEKVLLYFEEYCPQHEMIGISKALVQIHCSRRQLQRVLKQFCTRGVIEKFGKGKYRLVK